MTSVLYFYTIALIVLTACTVTDSYIHSALMVVTARCKPMSFASYEKKLLPSNGHRVGKITQRDHQLNSNLKLQERGLLKLHRMLGIYRPTAKPQSATTLVLLAWSNQRTTSGREEVIR